MSSLGSKSVAYGYSSACPSHAIGWDFKSLAQALANAKSSTVGFGLKAVNESDTYAWKKFNNGATIAITYNFTPSTPTGMTTDTSTACTTTSPPYLAVTSPKLGVVAADKNTSDPLWVTFEWQKSDGTAHNSYRVGPQTQGKFAYQLSTNTFTSGSTWQWRATATDGTATSGASPWCRFVVDLSKPAAPDISSSTLCGSAVYCVDQSQALPGTAQSFTFTAPPAPNNTAAVYYSWNGRPDAKSASERWKVALTAGQSASVTIYPPMGATSAPILFAQAYSAAGLFSENFASYTVQLNPPQQQAYWTFDDPDQAADDAQNNTVGPDPLSRPDWAATDWPVNDLSFPDQSAATVYDGGSGSGLSLLLNKTGPELPAPDGHGTATSGVPTLDPTTPGSFTVAAWANTQAPASQTYPSAVVTQDGLHTAPWLLDRAVANGVLVWRFAASLADTDTPGLGPQATIPIPTAQLNTWVHLVGSYNAGTHEMRLWVTANGVTTTKSATGDVKFAGLGATRVGALQWRSAITDHWQGGIDEVRIFSGAFDDVMVQQLEQTAPTP
jgi:hypothetical protein